MPSTDHLAAGNLSAALDAATLAVKQSPRSVPARTTLFELLAAAGQWDRARLHLDALAELAPEMAPGIAQYTGIIDAERFRARLFTHGEGAPQRAMPLPVDHEPILAGLRAMHAGDVAVARAAVEAIEEARPARRVVIDGTPCEDFRDADDLLGPVFEVFSQGRYGWLPIAQVSHIAFDPPKQFRDTLWRPAEVTLTGDLSCRAFFPVRYPGSETATDDLLRLGRSTEWVDRAGVVRGVGQHVFAANGELRALLDVSDLRFETPP